MARPTGPSLPSVSSSLSFCPPCPAASSLSTGQRSRRGLCRTSAPPYHHPCRSSRKPELTLDTDLRSVLLILDLLLRALQTRDGWWGSNLISLFLSFHLSFYFTLSSPLARNNPTRRRKLSLQKNTHIYPATLMHTFVHHIISYQHGNSMCPRSTNSHIDSLSFSYTF